MTDHIRNILAEVDPKTKQTRLEMFARRMLDLAESGGRGTAPIIKEIWDRIDGRPTQPIELDDKRDVTTMSDRELEHIARNGGNGHKAGRSREIVAKTKGKG